MCYNYPMMKKNKTLKLLLTLAMFISFLDAKRLEFSKDGRNPSNSDLTIFYNKYDVGTDWVGIYKENSSTAWENVIIWVWVKDLNGRLGREDTDRLWVGVKDRLPKGNYEARFFKNDSFVIEDSLKFKVEEKNLNFQTFNLSSTKSTVSVRVYLDEENKEKVTNKDWIGLYKVNASNDWNNVVKWIWAKDIIKNGGFHSWKNIENGIYELRYFINNSFKTFKVSEKVKIDANEVRLEMFTGNYYIADNSLNLGVVGKGASFLDYNPKDWIGLYKKDDSNELKNIIKWAWVKDLRQLGHIGREQERALIFKNIDLTEGDYEVRYFLNNSYETYAKQDIEIIDGSNPYLLNN